MRLKRWHCLKDWAKHPTITLREAKASPTATAVDVDEARNRQPTSRLLKARRSLATTADANHRMLTATLSSQLTPQRAMPSSQQPATHNNHTTQTTKLTTPSPMARRSHATNATVSLAADLRAARQLANRTTLTSRRQTRNRSLVARENQMARGNRIARESQTTVSVRTPSRSRKVSRNHVDNSVATVVSPTLQRLSLHQMCQL